MPASEKICVANASNGIHPKLTYANTVTKTSASIAASLSSGIWMPILFMYLWILVFIVYVFICIYIYLYIFIVYWYDGVSDDGACVMLVLVS